MRLVPTPLAASLAWPAPRACVPDPRLFEAVVAPAGVAASLARLREPGAVVVTTGQQPGLFTGPLYTVFKALSAVALARALEAAWRRPVVPVFWLATDDHDFVEANRAAWPTPDGGVRDWVLRERPAQAPLTPMYREVLGGDVDAALAQLSADLDGVSGRDEVLEWLGRHYHPEATVGTAYGGALAELLAPYGVICLDAGHRALKQLAAPWMLRALAGSVALERDLLPLAADLAARRLDPGVAIGDGATLVFVEGREGRDRLVRQGDRFVARRGGESFSLDDLSAIAAASPERLSPNVLLRPVVESALVPTVAYVAGPGELRYLALTPPVYEALDVRRQLPVPRWSGIIVEPRVDRVLGKFGLALDDLLAAEGVAEGRLIRDQLPAEVTGPTERLRQALEREYSALASGAAGIDPTLERAVLGVRGQAQHALDEMERKVMQHLKRRRETEMGQLARMRAAVRPLGRPQERVYTVAPFLARLGPGLIDELLSAISAWYGSALVGPPPPA
ncbi:MAG: bacillithiol biosynthesis cysteine-adding enzyme BshC [Gemmatimonadales bacterium]|jgi:bacillithiol biosynthesis cysteine-adding enzyme BshC|nr:bacillithiol biosynthesis cysteine-adding enzyme BshC [Gemmatimonadales bacterium]